MKVCSILTTRETNNNGEVKQKWLGNNQLRDVIGK